MLFLDILVLSTNSTTARDEVREVFAYLEVSFSNQTPGFNEFIYIPSHLAHLCNDIHLNV